MGRNVGSSRGRGSFIRLVAICAILLISSIQSVSGIGGWETIHILLGRVRGQTKVDEQKSPVSPPRGGGGAKKQDDGSEPTKKKHVGEVKMTSDKLPSSSSVASKSSSSGLDNKPGPAFVPRGRRGGVNLDDNDIKMVTFVGNSNPFL